MGVWWADGPVGGSEGVTGGMLIVPWISTMA
jgi:hypothetical protein